MNNPVHKLADTELDRVCGGSQMDMIALQSIMSKWQMMSPMTINMARALSDTTGAIIRNIK
jgi:hypothetical protein